MRALGREAARILRGEDRPPRRQDRGGVAIGDFYSGLIAEFIDVQNFHEEQRGFPAFIDAPLREGIVRTGPKVLLYVRRTKLRQVGGLRKEPYLWFYIHRAGRDDTFVVDCEMVLEALERAVPGMERLHLPVPAHVAKDPDDESVRAGAPRHLTLALVDVDRSFETEAHDGKGIRFEVAEEVGEEELLALYSFTMEPLAALLALGASVIGEAGNDPSAFERELDEFAAEIEAPILFPGPFLDPGDVRPIRPLDAGNGG
jgi:hypothetical protein